LQGKGNDASVSSPRSSAPLMAPPSLAGKGAGGLDPAVLVDMGDNIGGGSAGDSTLLLEELLQQGAVGWIMTLADPAAVAECVRAGVGRPVALTVGGKTDTLHGAPVPVRGRVRSLHEG